MESAAYQGAVLADQRHDVGDGADRHHVEVFAQVEILHRPRFEQGVGELEDHAGAAQVVELRALAVDAGLGIDHGDAGGAFVG